MYPYVDRYTDHRSPNDRYMHRYMHARYDPRTHAPPTRSISPPISPHSAFPTLFLTPLALQVLPRSGRALSGYFFFFLEVFFLPRVSFRSYLVLASFLQGFLTLLCKEVVSDAARGACRRNPCVSLCPRACLPRRCRSFIKALLRPY